MDDNKPSANKLTPFDIKRRFLLLHRERVLRIQESLSFRQKSFLELLPLLFHVNFKGLPGFVQEDIPSGISDYNPSKEAIAAATKAAKDFSYQKKARAEYHIYSIFLMGSSGTIAYTKKSDFDIWICINPSLTPDQIKQLLRKTAQIEAWSMTLGIESHFFLMNADQFREGKGKTPFSHESSGDIQHYLLLEEFYRTSIHIAGRYPAWWLVPVEQESSYEKSLQDIIQQDQLDTNDLIDFGPLNDIHAEEFYFATLWQLYKAIESPYKSLLKILLMETYTANFPAVSFLSQRMKQAIHQGETSINRLDSYLLMYRQVEEYLLGRDEPARLEIARRSFYLKIQESSQETSMLQQIRTELLAEFTKSWGWSKKHIQQLDSRSSWKIKTIIDERGQLINELHFCYKVICQFSKVHHVDQSAPSADLSLLSRKLFSAFDKKAGKIDLIHFGESVDLIESKMTFSQVNKEGKYGWMLFEDVFTEADKPKDAPIKFANSFIELYAWCYFNNLINQQAIIALQNISDNFSHAELRLIKASVDGIFPNPHLEDSTNEQLSAEETIDKAILYLNIGIDPLHRFTQKGLEIISERTDALSFSGFWENLVHSLELLYVTSWREILAVRYTGDAALLDCLCDFLSWFPTNAENLVIPDLPIQSFSCTRGNAIAARVKALLEDILRVFYGQDRSNAVRYILQMHHSYYVLQVENHLIRYEQHRSLNSLLKGLGNTHASFSALIFDPHTLLETPLPLIYEKNKSNRIQVFYQLLQEVALIYILDERGSLFSQQIPFHSKVGILSQLQSFLESTLEKRNQLLHITSADDDDDPIEFYQIQPQRNKKFLLEYQKLRRAPANPGYFSLQVLGDIQNDENALFTMFCSHREFSTVQYGDKIFQEIAAFVLQLRKTQEDYPIYITELTLSRQFFGQSTIDILQTLHFLQYKKWIEDKLNKALDALKER